MGQQGYGGCGYGGCGYFGGPFYGAATSSQQAAYGAQQQPVQYNQQQHPGYGASPRTPAAYGGGRGGAGSAAAYPSPGAPGMGGGAYSRPSYGPPGGYAATASYSQAGYSFAGFGMDGSYSGIGSGSGGVAGASTATPTGGPDSEMMQLVPSVLAGRLIGKGGSGIKEMRETSHAQIRILSECEPGTDQRKVFVSGTPEAINVALKLINQKIAQGP